MSSAPALIIPNAFTLTDRLKIQQERIRKNEYRKIGRLTCIVWEGQRSTKGFSQEHGTADVFGKWQRRAWSSCTLDWLGHANAPIVAISNDRHDLLLPFRLPALPDIPDPDWNGFAIAPGPREKAKTPRIPQLFANCPKVGDRACGRIQDRVSGKWFLIFRPLSELQVMCGGGKESGFGRIRCVTDPVEHTHSALLVNQEPDSAGTYEAYFVGGSFVAG